MRWWTVAALMLVALCGSAPAAADDGSLDGSTLALIMGPTGIPTPDAAYVNMFESLYLVPNGFDGTALALTTPETFDFGPSTQQGVQVLISTVESDYAAHDFSTADPLTIFGYSQSAMVASTAEQALANDGIPQDALRFVLIGDTDSAQGGFLNTWGDTSLGEYILNLIGDGNLINNVTPDNVYPTDVYTINGDGWAQWDDGVNLLGMFSTHDGYAGVTSEMVSTATQSVDGLTTYYDMTSPDILTTLWDALVNLG